jgi:ABC-type transport system involved in multi-copper enzyme maturation permease subunit
LHEGVRIIKDLGLAGISLIGIVIALFLGVNLLSKELERKTVYAIIPKPIHRWEFLLGKYVGLAITMAALVVVMSLMLWGFVVAQGGHHGVVMFRAEVLILFELLLLVAVAILFSSFSSPYLSAMFTAALWVIGRNTPELEAFARQRLDGRPLGSLLELVVRLVPDFHSFYISGANLGGEGVVSVHESFVSWSYVAQAASYGMLYSAVCVLVAMALFARRDFT